MSSAASASSATDAVAGSSESVSRCPKNAPGSRADVGWKYGLEVEGDRRKVQCKFCQKIISGGIYRFKHHLAGTQKDVGACKAVPDEVKKEMWDIVASLQEKLFKKSNDLAGISSSGNEEEGGEKRKREEIAANLFKKRGVSSQATLNSYFKRDMREEACRDVADFFYNNAIPFNVARSEEYHKMFESACRHGNGFKPPSYHELRVKYLKDKVEFTNGILDKHKAIWKKMGCTIMTDGWTDRRRRTLVNFLVNSPMGTVFIKSVDASHISKTADKLFKMIDEVVEEVGEDNVVQIVTDNAANYKAAGDLLMAKRKKLYWTPCAAHCIDLMLEDFEKKLPVHHETIARGKKLTTYIYSRTSLISLLHRFTQGGDLIRPAATRFATSYLTLGCLHRNKRALIRMFTSKEWDSSQCAKTKDGKFIGDVVMDKEFWNDIVTCMKGALPLIKVLRLVDSDETPAMGFIYEEMDQAKERILKAFNGVQRSYMPLWDIIDARWDNQLHRPLHAAGYYLNPQMHYSPNFKADAEVKHGFYDCLTRMAKNREELAKIDAQLENFKYSKGFFGSVPATLALKQKTPAGWWESYGHDYPELQRFAVRILSLTCSSSGCERNWSAFERVHTKKRNRLHAKTMNDVVYVMVNSKLSNKKKPRRKAQDYDIHDLSSDDDWIVDNDDVEELDLGGDDDGLASLEGLEIPNLEDDGLNEVLGGDMMDDGGEAEENEDQMEDNDDFVDQDLFDLLK